MFQPKQNWNIPTEISRTGRDSNWDKIYLFWHKNTGHSRQNIIKQPRYNHFEISKALFQSNQRIHPLEIWNLANLEAIDPDSNNISGSIHSKVGSLTSLRYLDLSSNQINNGSILYEIGNMENLKTLDLSSNNVHGSVPTMMCNLKALCPWVFHGLIPRLVGPLFHK